jgi:hypothetical protein
VNYHVIFYLHFSIKIAKQISSRNFCFVSKYIFQQVLFLYACDGGWKN